MTTLQPLLAAVPGAEVAGDPHLAVHGLVADSRQVQPGDAFVALRGARQDGHGYMQEAVRRGATVVVGESFPAEARWNNVTRVRVPDSRLALARMACAYYDHPSRQLELVGVTGTNGKTSTTFLLASIFRALGRPGGVLGTLGAITATERLPLANTTPDALELQGLLARFAARGLRVVAMEVSSHALAQGRVEGCRFDAALFTNLTQDHLDYHGTIEAYFQAKTRLFTDFAQRAAGERPMAVILNADDPWGRRLASLTPGAVTSYGLDTRADVMAEDIKVTPGGTTFTARTPAGRLPLRLQLVGRFNVANALAALAWGVARQAPLEALRAGLEAVPPVSGRMERLDEGQPFAVAVDYAHTPDGLEKALATAREMTAGRLLVVFGCGGDRDRGKRPLMGGLAARLADRVIVTSDNPRTEDPQRILEDIRAGIAPGGAPCAFVVDRREAIAQALALAGTGDFVLVAGKGHEVGQIFADCTMPFDDRAVAREVLRKLFPRQTP